MKRIKRSLRHCRFMPCPHAGVEVDKKANTGDKKWTATFCRRPQKVDGNFLSGVSTATFTPGWSVHGRDFIGLFSDRSRVLSTYKRLS